MQKTSDAAPTLSELSAKAGDSLMANTLFIDALENAYRSGKLREVGDGEYICKCGIRVVPHRCPTGSDF